MHKLITGREFRVTILLSAISIISSIQPAMSGQRTLIYPYGIRFSEKAWPAAGQKTPEGRLAIIDDFIVRYKLVGLSRARVHGYLGTEGMTTAPVEKLLLDSGTCLRGEHTYLEIEFDPSTNAEPNLQKATQYRVMKDFHGGKKNEVGNWCK